MALWVSILRLDLTLGERGKERGLPKLWEEAGVWGEPYGSCGDGTWEWWGTWGAGGAVKGLQEAHVLLTAAEAPVGGVQEAAKAPAGPRGRLQGFGAEAGCPGQAGPGHTGCCGPAGWEGRGGAHEERESRCRNWHPVRLASSIPSGRLRVLLFF